MTHFAGMPVAATTMDSAFMYVDLLVDKEYRGKEYGRLLMEQACLDYPGDTVYVTGDVYPYYEDKLGYEAEGKIYIVKARKNLCQE